MMKKNYNISAKDVFRSEISSQLNLTMRSKKPADTIIEVSGIKIGDSDIVIIAGPCSVENKEQLYQTAGLVQKYGARILRGGAFKPRTSPYSFQGLREKGVELLSQVRAEFNIPVVSEVMDTQKITLLSDHVDILQVGSRNMHNYALLEAVGKSNKPVLLKRGMSATIEEFLFAAEYIMKQGNEKVMLCERGIRTFETSTRFTLDISAVSLLKKISHLPVIVDPSHSSGHWWMVQDLSKAAIAAGADGLIIEVHYDPQNAVSDGEQSLSPDTFKIVMDDLVNAGNAFGRKISAPIVT
jgi:3-deoxy-7-phosphoheptulonate synthase